MEKTKHIIEFVNDQKKVVVYYKTVNMVKRCICKVLEIEGLKTPHEISVTFVCNKKIKKINKEFREKDSATDVLSFPVLEYTSDYTPIYGQGDTDMDGGAILLGDIIISLERANEQAQEYGHSETREVAYLTVHSMYHLLGYDHMDEKEKAIMRKKEESVLKLLGMER